MFLSQTEIAEMTGYKLGQTKRSAKWLADHHYRFELRKNGSIAILRSHVEERLMDSPGVIRNSEPDLSWMDTTH